MMNEFPNDLVLVFAHPDDEVLWASSLLMKASKVIICFMESHDDIALSRGRRKVIDSIPLDNFIYLGVKETGVFHSSDWRNPTETEHGVLCSNYYGNYESAFYNIKKMLSTLISKGQTVVTHNPWGEYGHEEHVLVYKVVHDISRELDLNIFVTGYVSNRSVYLMNNHVGELDGKLYFQQPDHEIALKLKALYQENNCWTWRDDYQWPSHEIFYEINSCDGLGAKSDRYSAVPVNFILFNEAVISSRDIIKFIYYRIYGVIKHLSLSLKRVLS